MRHLLSILDLTPDELSGLLAHASRLKAEWKRGGNRPILAGKILGMIFQKPSLRTRVSFDVGMQQLGGTALYLSPAEISLGQRESIPDVARVLGRYVQGIMARVFDHAHIQELAAYSPVPVINGLSDYTHPCQTLADLLTLQEHFGDLRGLTLAYVGDSNNVTRSLLFGGVKLGMHIRIGSPAGYTLDAETLDKAEEFAVHGATVTVTEDPTFAVTGAQVVYTDTWTSMGQEAEAEIRRGIFPPYQVNADLLSQADKKAVVLHCLPAHRGEEITDEIADGPQSLIFDQAENRLHAQKAILAWLLSDSEPKRQFA